ncbi:hypothetical protein GGI21_005613, partial [Coemansia aciculifera]
MLAANPGRLIPRSTLLRATRVASVRYIRTTCTQLAGKGEADSDDAKGKAPAVRRFWRNAGVDERNGKYVITLDGRPVKTPDGTQ